MWSLSTGYCFRFYILISIYLGNCHLLIPIHNDNSMRTIFLIFYYFIVIFICCCSKLFIALVIIYVSYSKEIRLLHVSQHHFKITISFINIISGFRGDNSKHVEVLCFRDRSKDGIRNISHSIVLILKLPSTKSLTGLYTVTTEHKTETGL